MRVLPDQRIRVRLIDILIRAADVIVIRGRRNLFFFVVFVFIEALIERVVVRIRFLVFIVRRRIQLDRLVEHHRRLPSR